MADDKAIKKKDKRVKEEGAKNPCLLTAHILPEMREYLQWCSRRDGSLDFDLWLSLALVEYINERPWENLNYKLAKSLPKVDGLDLVQCPFTCQPVVYLDGRAITGIELRQCFRKVFDDLKSRSVPAYKQDGSKSTLSERSLVFSFYLWLVQYRFNKAKVPQFRPITRFALKDSFSSLEEVVLNDD